VSAFGLVSFSEGLYSCAYWTKSTLSIILLPCLRLRFLPV
jgi:hypothetical protein